MQCEDEKALTALSHLLPGQNARNAQVEGVIAENKIKYRIRRQLLAKRVDVTKDILIMRFLNFYSSQVKQLAVGASMHARDEEHSGLQTDLI